MVPRALQGLAQTHFALLFLAIPPTLSATSNAGGPWTFWSILFILLWLTKHLKGINPCNSVMLSFIFLLIKQVFTEELVCARLCAVWGIQNTLLKCATLEEITVLKDKSEINQIVMILSWPQLLPTPRSSLCVTIWPHFRPKSPSWILLQGFTHCSFAWNTLPQTVPGLIPFSYFIHWLNVSSAVCSNNLLQGKRMTSSSVSF